MNTLYMVKIKSISTDVCFDSRQNREWRRDSKTTLQGMFQGTHLHKHPF